MPPPPRFTKQRKPLPHRTTIRPHSNATATTSSTSNAPVPFDQDKFEDELNWCVHHLKTTLSTQKLPEKKGMEMVNGLGALQNPKVALIKKRQIMRNLVGDYRDKMELEKNKTGGVAVKISKPQNAKQFKLFKTAAKRASMSAQPVLVNSNFKLIPSENSFRFSFSPPDSSSVALLPPPSTSSNTGPSPFRFNFSVEKQGS